MGCSDHWWWTGRHHSCSRPPATWTSHRVIEANDRLGGRTYTIEDEGCKVELGGTWIHWTQPFIWAEKERYGLEIEETPGCVAEHVAIHRGDRIEALGEHEIAEFMGGFDLFFSEATSVWERPYDAHHSWKAIQ